MRYMGGKTRISKELAEFMESQRSGEPYIEPFVGGASVLSKMSGVRYASDINKYLIAMYQKIQIGWVPPQNVSEEEYKTIKQNRDDDIALSGFVGFGCSFGGKWFDTYARGHEHENFARASSNSLIKIRNSILDVTFSHIDYREIDVSGFLIYCDPPYRGVSKYDINKDFDHDEFWEKMRQWSKNNKVFISEYTAPEDFECVWQKETNLEMRTSNGREKRIEKLFKHLESS